jgi:hypothetical protein
VDLMASVTPGLKGFSFARRKNQNCSVNITLPTVRSTVTIRRTGSQV